MRVVAAHVEEVPRGPRNPVDVAGALAGLVAEPSPQDDHGGLANDVVAAWYSGLSPKPDATQVTGFNSALVWNALTYTKPWGSCGGNTGYWGDPPADPVP